MIYERFFIHIEWMEILYKYDGINSNNCDDDAGNDDDDDEDTQALQDYV